MSKKCQVCGWDVDHQGVTCPACGEASFESGPALEPTPAPPPKPARKPAKGEA